MLKEAEKKGFTEADFLRQLIIEHFNKNEIMERIDRLDTALGNLNFDSTAAIAGLTAEEKEIARSEVNEIYQDIALG